MLSRIAEPAAVCVGASKDHVDYVLPFAYSARYQRRTGIKVSVTVGPPQMTIPAAARGKLDFVITDAAGVRDGRLEHELLSLLPVQDFRWRCQVYAAYRSLDSLSPAARGLLAHLKAVGINVAEREECA